MEKRETYFETFKQATMKAMKDMSKYIVNNDPMDNFSPGENWQSGVSYLQAMNRIAIDELSQAIKPFPDGIGFQPEPGAPFEPTPHEVYEQKHDLEPLQAYQRDMPKREVSKEKEMER